jgi:hypothetical protein
MPEGQQAETCSAQRPSSLQSISKLEANLIFFMPEDIKEDAATFLGFVYLSNETIS